MNIKDALEKAVPETGKISTGRTRRILAWGTAALLATGGFLCTAVPEQPANVPLPRTIALTHPDSVILNLEEGYRVASPTAYMRSIQDSTATDPIRFTAFFSQAEASELQDFPSQGAAKIYLNGGWHDEQERNAITSALNTYPSTADSNRLRITKRRPLSGNQMTIDYVLGLHIALGNVDTLRGSADLVFHQNATGEWKISEWTDFPSTSPGRPVRSYYGALRLLNIGQ